MNEQFRPLAYVSIRDREVRDRVASTLDRAAWATIEEPTGFHLLRAIADVVDGAATWLRPAIIVIDAFSRGCAGTTIAVGLRDLGIEIPIVLVTAPGQTVTLARTDPMLHVVDAAAADRAVAQIVRAATPTVTQEAACNRTSTSRTSSNAA